MNLINQSNEHNIVWAFRYQVIPPLRCLSVCWTLLSNSLVSSCWLLLKARSLFEYWSLFECIFPSTKSCQRLSFFIVIGQYSNLAPSFDNIWHLVYCKHRIDEFCCNKARGTLWHHWMAILNSVVFFFLHQRGFCSAAHPCQKSEHP